MFFYSVLCTPPTWLKTTPEDVVDHIIKLAQRSHPHFRLASPSMTPIASPSHIYFASDANVITFLFGDGTWPIYP